MNAVEKELDALGMVVTEGHVSRTRAIIIVRCYLSLEPRIYCRLT
jgi:hypothetical protein